MKLIKREKLWMHLNRMGKKIIKSYNDMGKKYDVKIVTNNFTPLPSFEFVYDKNNVVYTTYIIQELLKKDILGANAIYLSMAHKEKDIEKYLDCLDRIFINLSKIIKSNVNKSKFLEIPVIDLGFKRLT